MKGTLKNQRRSIPQIILALVLVSMTISCSFNPFKQSSFVQVKPVQASLLQPAYNLPEGQGLYESCPLLENPHCLDRLKQMAEAGFKLVVNYDQLNATSGQELAYADMAHELGMKIIWAVNAPAFWNGSNLLQVYKNLGFTCACSDNLGFIHYFVNLVKNLPATWGYLVGENVAPGDKNKMKVYSDLIKQFDPQHPRLAISIEDSTSLGTFIRPFLNTTDVLGSAIYPIGASTANSTIKTVGSVARSLQAFADSYNRQTVVVLQAYSVAQYRACSLPPSCARFPTRDEMRQMRDQVLSNAQPQFILWYSYFDIMRSDNPSTYWTNLVDAAGVRPTA